MEIQPLRKKVGGIYNFMKNYSIGSNVEIDISKFA